MNALSVSGTTTETLLKCWDEARTRFTDQLQELCETDLKMVLPPCTKKIGLLIRHIADVELFFAKNVFGAEELKVFGRTIIPHIENLDWTNLKELKTYVSYSGEMLKNTIGKQKESHWEEIVNVKELGRMSKSAVFGRLISHTAYHAGQIAIVKKYGVMPKSNSPNVFGMFEKKCS